jgi:hypothetical protein
MVKRSRIQSAEELAAQRSMRRMRDELGINAAGIEVIVRLRSQIVELQQQVAEMERMLNAHATRRQTRLESYRSILIEATWREWTDEEER